MLPGWACCYPCNGRLDVWGSQGAARKRTLEAKRPGASHELQRRGDRPERVRRVLQDESTAGGADDPADLPRLAREREVAADRARRGEVRRERKVNRPVQALADREDDGDR